jgi:hypothetical protein
MDILALIYYHELTIDEAYDIFDDLIARIHNGEASPDWPNQLGLSIYETAAYLHAVGFEGLLKLRYEGWPTSCCRCGMPLDYRQFGWWCCRDDLGDVYLRHLECPLATVSSR